MGSVKMRMLSICIVLFYLSSHYLMLLFLVLIMQHVVTFPKQFVSVTFAGIPGLYTCEQHVGYFE